MKIRENRYDYEVSSRLSSMPAWVEEAHFRGGTIYDVEQCADRYLQLSQEALRFSKYLRSRGAIVTRTGLDIIPRN